MDRSKKSLPINILGGEKEIKTVKKLSESTGMDKQLNIGPTIKKIMQQRSLTLKEVSHLTSVPSSTLQHIVNGRNVKDISTLIKISKGLEISLHYLLFGQEDGQEIRLSALTAQDLFSGVFEIVIRKQQQK